MEFLFYVVARGARAVEGVRGRRVDDAYAEEVAVVALAGVVKVFVHSDSSEDVGQRDVPCAALVRHGADGRVGGRLADCVVSHQDCPKLGR